MKRRMILAMVAVLLVLGCGACSDEASKLGKEQEPQAMNSVEQKQIATPPGSLELDPFYKKYISVGGIPVVSSEDVADEALLEVDYLIGQILSNRPDILKSMAEGGVRITVIGAKQQMTDIPEYSHMKPSINQRARGLGGRMTSCGEENLLNYPGDRYVGENIFIHEFAHCIHRQLRRIDKDFNRKLKQLYEQAMAKEFWQNTYAAENHDEYWAEGVQSWLDCNRESRDGKPNGVHNHVNTREELEAYDPNLAKFVADTFGNMQWRYQKYADRKAKQAKIANPEEVSEEIPDGKVVGVPDSARQRFELDPFYQKYVSCKGLPIMSSGRVADAALLRANELVNKLLAGRQDIREAMIERGVRLVIIGANEVTTDIPEYSDMKPKEYWDERARGFGGRMTSCGEENLLCLPIDRYDDENILIHEFGGHCVHSTLRKIDKEFDNKLRQLYEKAIAKGLWKDTYAGSNRSEYWAEAVQSYFDSNRQNNWNHNHINTRKELYAYDPELAQLVADTFRLTKETDWRYKPLAKQPQVTTPPKPLKCDPFYKKYVYCRSLPLLGSDKPVDAALLEANYLIRNMFNYRHDILKPMIDDGLRVVILGEDEKITDVPECNDLKDEKWRVLGCSPQQMVIVCGQENLLAGPNDKYAGENILIKEFARAAYVMTGLREIDEEFEKRRQKQQYELYGVQRMDKRFDAELKGLYEKAMEEKLWENTLAAKDCFEYWAEGVQSWFDCNRESTNGKPNGMHNHVNTREELESYDPDLAKLIAKVFRHTERVDWRYRRAADREVR